MNAKAALNHKKRNEESHTVSSSKVKVHENRNTRHVATVKMEKKVRTSLAVDDSAADLRKRERTPTAGKEQHAKSGSAYSPIKTRGLYKKQVRVTERCRLCKANTGGFMTCTVCQTKYHLECLGYASESVRLVFERRLYTWLCPACIYCCACNEFICDAGNVQCFACDRAFHGNCRPKSGVLKNPKDPLSNWFCPDCEHLANVEISENSGNTPSSSGSQSENESSERKSISKNRHRKRDYVAAFRWKSRLQAERDAINDRLKDLCREELAEKERKQQEDLKRQTERENFLPRRKTKFSAMITKKMKRSYLECEQAKNIKIIEGVKFSVMEKKGLEQQISGAEKQRIMKGKTSTFDYNLYMAAKKEFLATQPSEDVSTGEDISARMQWVQFGPKRLLARYASAYPKCISESPNVYVCRFCLTAVEDSTMYEIHMAQCEWRHPPGNEIYRENGLSFWEIDGVDEIAYCRRLCLLSKLFLFSKTLHHEVETFLFYILTELTSEGYVLLGYFSKEKNPSRNNNLSCLLTLPSSQRTGYGKFLIDLSYKLSLRERKIGGPEHPLSDLGLITYRSYWKAVIVSYIRTRRHVAAISIKEMSNETGIHSSDIVSTMLDNNMLKYRDGNYLINKKKALTAPLHTFRRRVVHPEQLVWEPEFDVERTIKMGTYVD